MGKTKRLRSPEDWRPRSGVHPGRQFRDKSKYDRKDYVLEYDDRGEAASSYLRSEVMTLREALEIRELKKQCTYRYLAEQLYPPTSPMHGNQLAGQDLCRTAFEVLYPELEMSEIQLGHDEGFDSLNKSRAGEFYWWE